MGGKGSWELLELLLTFIEMERTMEIDLGNR